LAWVGKTHRGLLLALGLLAASLLPACGRGGSPYVKSVEQTPSGFFRVFADIRVKETGEIVKLDYVVACGGTVTNWTYTTSSVSFGMTPQIMLVPTSSGQLIGARTPEVCDGNQWQPIPKWNGRRPPGPDPEPDYYIEKVPDDFLPLLMWYPNADDLSFSIGYLSDVAYESPYSKMELLDSGIEATDYEAWKVWRERAASSFKQIGALPGPWGYQLPGRLGSSKKQNEQIRALNHGRDANVSLCYSLNMLELPDSIQKDVLELLPDTERDWVTIQELDEGGREKLFGLLKTADFNGGSFYSHMRLYQEDGVRRSTGGGAFSHNQDADGDTDKNDFYHDTYPVAIYQKVQRPGFDRDTWEHHILLDEEWKGFAFCGLSIPSVADLTAYGRGELETVRPDYVSHDWLDPQWLKDGENVVATTVGYYGHRHMIDGHIGPIINRDGRVISTCCWR